MTRLVRKLAGYKWEFNLIDTKEVNTWCMPAGKVVVYTNLLSFIQNESELAIVMGREFTHALIMDKKELARLW